MKQMIKMRIIKYFVSVLAISIGILQVCLPCDEKAFTVTAFAAAADSDQNACGCDEILSDCSVNSDKAQSELQAMLKEAPVYGLLYHGASGMIFSAPNINSVELPGFAQGAFVEITGAIVDEADVLWYEIRLLPGNETGYAESYYVAAEDERFLSWKSKYVGDSFYLRHPRMDGKVTALDGTAEADQSAYAAGEKMADNGISDFPQSYKAGLNALAAKHPEWVFVAFDTNVKWDSAVSNEMKDNRSWIEGSANSAYVNKDEPKGGNWYLATKKGVEYYMDPRNFLDNDHVFMFEILTYNSSYQNTSFIQDMFASSFMKGTVPDDDENRKYSQMFVDIGKSLKVSPVHLGARVLQEQGYSGSDMVSGTYSGYKGYYNFFNVGASGTGTAALESGLKRAKEEGWNTRYKSIYGGANVVTKNYIQAGQNNLYLEKWDFVGTPYTHQYMQNIRAPYYEAAKIKSVYSKAGVMDSAFVFRIPVFSDMKENNPTPTPTPGEDEVETAPLESIKLTPLNVTLKAGQEKALVLEHEPIVTTDSVLKVAYKSSNEAVASVNSAGAVHGISKGSAKITATIVTDKKTFTATADVTVNDCTLTYYNASGSKLKTVTAAYGQRFFEVPYEKDNVFPLAKEQENKAFAGYFTKPECGGLMLGESDVIKSDMDIYPCYVPLTGGLDIIPVGDRYYDNEAIKPHVQVYDNKKALILGRDYTLSYKNNKKASAGSLAQIVIKGKGNYKGSKSASFKILPLDFSNESVQVIPAMGVFTGKEQYLNPTVIIGGKTLKKGTDYTLTYTDKGVSGAYTRCGSYGIKVKGKGNYSGEIETYEKISRAASIAKCKLVPGAADYTGEQLKADASVMLNDEPLREGIDYELLEPADMTTPGKHTITIVGLENAGYTGKKSFSFYIHGTALKGAAVSAQDVDFKADGELKQYVSPNVSVTDVNGHLLNENEDYFLSYTNAYGVGSATVTVTGIGKYEGTIKRKYKITPCQLNDASENVAVDITQLLGKGWFLEKSGAVPPVKVTAYGYTLRQGSDYTVKYLNNKLEGTGSVTITGKGIYTGVINKDFSIVAADSLFGLSEGSLDISSAKFVTSVMKYTGEDVILKAENLLMSGKEGSLNQDTDYVVIPESYGRNSSSGTGFFYVRGIGRYKGIKKITFKILPKEL